MLAMRGGLSIGAVAALPTASAGARSAKKEQGTAQHNAASMHESRPLQPIRESPGGVIACHRIVSS